MAYNKHFTGKCVDAGFTMFVMAVLLPVDLQLLNILHQTDQQLRIAEQPSAASMSPQPASPDLSTTQLNGIVEVAQQIAGVAAFIKNEFCSGHLAASMPLYAFMKDSAQRLHSYGWPLVSELEPRKAHLPWDVRSMKTPEAFEAMDRLADFFERRAIESPNAEVDDAGLAADLRFLARYTSLVTASTKEEPRSGPLTPPRSPLDGLSVLSRGPFVVSKPQSRSNTTMIPSLKQPEQHLELPPPAIEISNTVQPTAQDSSTGAHSPHDLRPLPDDIDHSNHPLGGRRLTRRSWFQDDAHFLELIGDDHKQWVAPAPTAYATIGGGEGAFACWHYVDASVLGISAVNVIKLEHPLNAKEVRAIDIDILRFVRLMLYDWVGGNLKRPDRIAEKKSLEIVRRELAHRVWLMGRGHGSAPHTPELTVLSEADTAEVEDIEPLGSSASSVIDNDAADDAEEGLQSDAPVPAPDLLNPTPDLRSLRATGETLFDRVLSPKLAKPAPGYTGLAGFSCKNDSCSYCALHAQPAASGKEYSTSNTEPVLASGSVDGIDHGNNAKHVHFEEPIIKVHRATPTSFAPEDPIAVHPVLLQNLLQADVVDGNSFTTPTKAPSKPASGGMGDMTELLLQSRCAALGLPIRTVERRAEHTSPAAESSSQAARRGPVEQRERESLQNLVDELKAEIATLRQEINEPLTETTPQEPADSSQKTKRTDEEDKHPLQHLVGQRFHSTSSSTSGAPNSTSNLSSETDHSLQYHTSASTTPSSPSHGHWLSASQEASLSRWLAPLSGIKVTTTPDGGRTFHHISQPNPNYNYNLAESIWRGEGWKHGYGSPAAARDKACAALKCRGNERLTSLFAGDPEYRGLRGPSSEERASALAESEALEAEVEAEAGERSMELRSSRGRPRIEDGVVVGSDDSD